MNRKGNPIYKPSHILRLVRKGVIADPQPKGEGIIRCEAKRHKIDGDTESPTFYTNGDYVWCAKCKGWMLARIDFATFTIDLTGERKVYPLRMKDGLL